MQPLVRTILLMTITVSFKIEVVVDKKKIGDGFNLDFIYDGTIIGDGYFNESLESVKIPVTK